MLAVLRTIIPRGVPLIFSHRTPRGGRLLFDLLTFSAGKKSKQKSPLAKLCSSSNYLANLALCT
jgi:hypothetical protein